MTTLHLIKQSQFNTNVFSLCGALLSKDDAIVLLDDGVYNTKHPEFAALVSALGENVKDNVFVIEHHFVARGLTNLQAQISSIPMTKLVDLSLAHDKTVTW
ncbi:MAG: sulfurtransferase complex subunit TusB [Colwelliaceae bacterium]|nr:sulfurtransferase complex subunit TusB [Colwelliaceae bacterium]